jgi:hypothetical protein
VAGVAGCLAQGSVVSSFLLIIARWLEGAHRMLPGLTQNDRSAKYWIFNVGCVAQYRQNTREWLQKLMGDSHE